MDNKSRRGKTKSLKKDIIELGVMCLVTFTVVKVFFIFIQHGEVNGASMEPSFHDSDFILYFKLKNEYNKDDIVVFKYNERLNEYYINVFSKNNLRYSNDYILDEYHIKRIVGVPGDEILIENGNLYVNKELISSTTSILPYQKYTLKHNEYFVSGDNIDNSFDSRFHGPLKVSEIEGDVLTNK